MTTTSTPRRPDTAPEHDPRPAASRPGAVRRRDGITLAATGAIPHRVRAQVLAEHRADLNTRASARVRARIDAGLYPLPLPYGYRRISIRPATLPGDTRTAHPFPDLSGPAETATAGTWTADRGRCGRAPALEWRTDHDCADTIRLMTRCIDYGMTPAQVAALLNTDPLNIGRDHPPLLTLSGHPQRWNARGVRSLLTDPVLTGHSVWGRTHRGRPRPRHEWIISAALTHPPILDTATIARTVEILTGEPATTRQREACSAPSRWRR